MCNIKILTCVVLVPPRGRGLFLVIDTFCSFSAFASKSALCSEVMSLWSRNPTIFTSSRFSESSEGFLFLDPAAWWPSRELDPVGTGDDL